MHIVWVGVIFHDPVNLNDLSESYWWDLWLPDDKMVEFWQVTGRTSLKVCRLSSFTCIYYILKKTASFKWPFDPPNGGHLTPKKGLLWIQTMSLWRTCRFFQRYIHTFRPYKWREGNLPTPNLPVFFFLALTACTNHPSLPKSWPRSVCQLSKKRWSRDQVCWKWYLWEWFLEW